MNDTLPVHEPLVVNVLGHWGGALLFAIFLYLLRSDRTGARLPGGRLAAAAAWLALVWNAASVGVLALAAADAGLAHVLVAVSSTALSMLPAVLFHLSAGPRFRRLVIAGYAFSGLAVAIHSSELVLPAPHHHRFALVLITASFGVLTTAAAWAQVRMREASRRRVSQLVGAMALFLFALTFAHMDQSEGHRSWALELLVHHAGVPLSLLILLQEYRFLLLDAFARLLANILLAAVFALGAARAGEAMGLVSRGGRTPFEQATLLVAFSLLLVLFALLRSGLQRVLSRVAFQRADLEQALRTLRSAGAGAGDEAAYLNWAAGQLAAFPGARRIPAGPSIEERLRARDLRSPTPAMAVAGLRDELEQLGVDVVVPLRLPTGEPHHILLGRRRGGRRYLSEDLAALDRLAAEAAERLEHFRQSEMSRLAAQAELRALQSQIHPHFLFNALNTLYGVIPRQAAGARRMVLNLADIFRYFLQAEKAFLPLEKEMEIVRAYLEVEQMRLGPKLRTEIRVDERAGVVPIPVLSVEPLVENAVKHGVASRAGGGVVAIEATVEDGELRVVVRDTGPGFAAGNAPGIGLSNVERRLKLCYGADRGLRVESAPHGATVEFRVPAGGAVEAAP